jgi:hypothetical protein
MEQRLDAIDQALLGLLPRQDRLAAIAQVEARIREIAAASPATAAPLDTPSRGLTLHNSAISNLSTEPLSFFSQPQFFGPGLGGQVPSTQKKRSRLAISAAVLGILAIGLLFMIPVSYLTVMTLGEILGEVVAIGLLGAHAVALVVGGMAAIGLGLAALVHLHRRKEQLVGHGWAIAGLCAGAVPLFIGFASVLFVGLEMGVADYFMTSATTVASERACSPNSADEDDLHATPRSMPDGGSPVVEVVPTVQSVMHEASTTWTPATEAAADSVCPYSPSQPDSVPRAAQPPVANPDPSPRQELPIEPGSSPESAPAIST